MIVRGVWVKSPKDVRRENSRDWYCKKLPDGTYLRYCEECGDEIKFYDTVKKVWLRGTVNAERRLCNRCLNLKIKGNGFTQCRPVKEGEVVA